jgi:hypothetical protein
MIRSFALTAVAALALAAPAGAQHYGGSPVSSGGRTRSSVESPQSAGGAWTGTASKWGGSPVVPASTDRQRVVYVIPGNAYLPQAIAAPAPVATTYVIDTVYASQAAQAAPVDMKVVTSAHQPSQPTTMDVYRQQARFRQP